MSFSLIDTLFNAFLFLFWMEAWATLDDRSFFFNPYLSKIGKATDTVLRFLQPVFLKTPPRVVAAVSLLFLLVFRVVVIFGITGANKPSWRLPIGLAIEPVEVAGPTEGIVWGLALSVLSFLLFVYKLWSLSLLYSHASGGALSKHPADALEHVARPFSQLHIQFRVPVLVAAGTLLGAGILFVKEGAGSVFWTSTPAGTLVLKCLLLGVIAFLDILPLVVNLIFGLIIASWIGLFLGSRRLAFLVREWLDLLIGPLRKYPIRIGMFDLSALLLAFVLQIVYSQGITYLGSVYLGL